MRWWDIPAVMLLECQTFPDDAWSVGMFWSELAEAASRFYVVTEEYGPDPAHPDPAGPRIIAYAGLLIGIDEAEVQTIAVDPAREGRGLGATLLTELMREAARRGCDDVLLEVRADNARAQRLYQRFGFEQIGLRRGYYQPANVDAFVMRAGGVSRRFGDGLVHGVNGHALNGHALDGHGGNEHGVNGRAAAHHDPSREIPEPQWQSGSGQESLDLWMPEDGPGAPHVPDLPYDPDTPYDPHASYGPQVPYDPREPYEPAPYGHDASYAPQPPEASHLYGTPGTADPPRPGQPWPGAVPDPGIYEGN